MNLESLCDDWTPQPGLFIKTKQGPRFLRKGTPNEKFWAAWREDKETMRELGMAPSKPEGSDEWQVCWWRVPPPEFFAKLKSNIQASQAADANIEVPAPAGCKYLPYQRAAIAFALNLVTGK